MSQVRTFGRFVSGVVMTALMVVAIVMAPCAAFAGPLSGGAVAGSGACTVGGHGHPAVVGMSAEPLEITMELSAAPSFVLASRLAQGIGDLADAASAELPPPTDPRHGRVRV